MTQIKNLVTDKTIRMVVSNRLSILTDLSNSGDITLIALLEDLEETVEWSRKQLDTLNKLQ
jgi:hypothetical protein